jgi:sulfur relay (sulfurtransferase) DsrC/TusE family protein
MEGKEKRDSLKNYRKVIKFVDKYYKEYDEMSKLTISVLIYTLHNVIKSSKYYNKDIENYKNINFRINNNEFYKYCDVSIEDGEQYKVFFSEKRKDEYVEMLAENLVSQKINEINEKFPGIINYIDKFKMIKDYILSEESLIDSVDETCYHVRGGLFELFIYRIK